MAKALRRIEQCLDAGLHHRARRRRRRLRLPRGGRRRALSRAAACSSPAAYISQTGGHGDKRRRSEWIAPIDCCIGMVGVIADGADEVRKAVREQLRHDVDQIKIMASGGAMSPGDELDTTQYTRRGDARRRRGGARRRASTCWPTPTPPPRCATRIEAGVRSIEHGNLIDDGGRAAPSRTPAPSSCRRWSPTRPSAREGKRYGIGDAPAPEDRPGAGAERGGPDPRLPRRLQDRLGLRPPGRHGGPAPARARAEGPGDDADGGAALGDPGQRRALPARRSDRHRRARQGGRPHRRRRQPARRPAHVPGPGAPAPRHEGRRRLPAAAVPKDPARRLRARPPGSLGRPGPRRSGRAADRPRRTSRPRAAG